MYSLNIRRLTRPLPFCQDKLKAHLKKTVILAYGYSIIPGSVVEEIFKVAELREV